MRQEERRIEARGADKARREGGYRRRGGRRPPFDARTRNKPSAGNGDPGLSVGIAHLMMIALGSVFVLMSVHRSIRMTVDVSRVDRVDQRVRSQGAESSQEQRGRRSQTGEAHHTLLTEALGKRKCSSCPDRDFLARLIPGPLRFPRLSNILLLDAN